MHIELATTSDAHQTELVTRLKELGATPADVGQGVGPYLEFRRTPDDEVVGNRVHLDVMSDPVEDQTREVARLEGLGATRAAVGQGDVSWVVLADPAGNEFCVLGRG